MALLLFIIFSFIISFLFFLIALVKQRKTPIIQNRSPLPPGPSKLPFIGHLHHLLLGMPHHSLRDLATIYGPIMHLKLGEISAVVISSPAMAEHMMKTHDLKFVDRPCSIASKIMSYEGRDILMAPYGEYWRQVRKICISELLSTNRVQSFWSVREEEVANLIRCISLDAGAPINLSEKIFALTNDIFARIAFGRTCKDKEVFMSVLKEMIGLGLGFAIPDLFPSLKFLELVSGIKPKLEMMHQKFDKIIEDITNEHQVAIHKTNKVQLSESLLGLLLRLQQECQLQLPITKENVKAVIFDMFAAGTDTSSTALEWAFSELIRNPRVMEKAQAEVRGAFHGKNKIGQEDLTELNYLRSVIKEALRLHPPLPLLVPRECREKCEMGGYEIPKRTKVIVNAWAIGRDPEHWKDPESFKPERFQDEDIDYKGTNFKYIPFGAGRRMCPGIMFGIANVELPLALLLYHYNWRPASGVKSEELDMTERFGISVRRKTDLYLMPTHYNPV